MLFLQTCLYDKKVFQNNYKSKQINGYTLKFLHYLKDLKTWFVHVRITKRPHVADNIMSLKLFQSNGPSFPSLYIIW